jgi:hypothetical protein
MRSRDPYKQQNKAKSLQVAAAEYCIKEGRKKRG